MSNPSTKLKNIFFVATQQSIRIWIATKNLLIEVSWFFFVIDNKIFLFLYNHKSKKAAHMLTAYILTIGAIIAYLKLYGSTPVCYSYPIIDDNTSKTFTMFNKESQNPAISFSEKYNDLGRIAKEFYINSTPNQRRVIELYCACGLMVIFASSYNFNNENFFIQELVRFAGITGGVTSGVIIGYIIFTFIYGDVLSPTPVNSFLNHDTPPPPEKGSTLQENILDKINNID